MNYMFDQNQLDSRNTFTWKTGLFTLQLSHNMRNLNSKIKVEIDKKIDLLHFTRKSSFYHKNTYIVV